MKGFFMWDPVQILPAAITGSTTMIILDRFWGSIILSSPRLRQTNPDVVGEPERGQHITVSTISSGHMEGELQTGFGGFEKIEISVTYRAGPR